MPERKISVLGEASDGHDAIVAATAELIRGQIEFLKGGSGGALVRMTVPLSVEETHAGA
jgi:hypothetical protein